MLSAAEKTAEGGIVGCTKDEADDLCINCLQIRRTAAPQLLKLQNGASQTKLLAVVLFYT